MRRALYVVIILLICISLAGCDINSNKIENNAKQTEDIEETQETPKAAETDEATVETPMPVEEATPEPSETAEPAERPSPTVEPTLPKEQQRLGIADAVEVCLHPEAYIGEEFGSVFVIMSKPMEYQNKVYYYAMEYTKIQEYCDEFPAMQAALFFEEETELKVKDIVYVKGIVGGRGYSTGDDGKNTELLILNVEELEREAINLEAPQTEKEIAFRPGQYAVRYETFSLEITSLSFGHDSMVLNTKASDSDVSEFATYEVDIIIHQDGWFWWSGWSFFINKYVDSVDNIPFPVMQTDKDMTIEFVIYSEDGELLYEPLAIEVELGE